MEQSELRGKLSALKFKSQSFLNDTYLWVNVARKSILEIPSDKLIFEVPKAKSYSSTKIINRNNGKEVINRIINRDIYYSAYVSSISQIEDYYNKLIKLLLKYDNNRIKVTLPNITMNSQISIIDFIDVNRDEMIEKIIDERIYSLFYASPQKQLEYFKCALGIELPMDLWYKWIEYKARRDVIVHNSGIINQVYINKAGNLAIGFINEEIAFSDVNFKKVISDLKSLVGSIDVLARKEFKLSKTQ